MRYYEFKVTYRGGESVMVQVPGATRVCAELWLHSSPEDFGVPREEIKYIDYIGVCEES